MTVDRDQVAADWRKCGFSCDLWVDPPGQVWENFVHDTDEWVCVVAGVLEMEVGGERTTLKSGGHCFIPAGVYHSVRNVGGVTARWLYGYRGRGGV